MQIQILISNNNGVQKKINLVSTLGEKDVGKKINIINNLNMMSDIEIIVYNHDQTKIIQKMIIENKQRLTTFQWDGSKYIENNSFDR